jgi:ribosomal protein S18 acetylase RimI-like enzyme
MFQAKSPSDFARLYFDKTIPVWSDIEKVLKVGDTDRHVFFFAESGNTVYTENTLVSRPVFRWFDANWSTVMEFCESKLNTTTAYKRFRTVDNIYGEDYESEDIAYTNRNLALCINANGRIEGFMLVATTEDADDFDEGENALKLDVICTGPKGRGIGKYMVEALKEYAEEAGYFAITLDSVTSAVSFYKGLGFEEIPNKNMQDTVEMIWEVESESEEDD